MSNDLTIRPPQQGHVRPVRPANPITLGRAVPGTSLALRHSAPGAGALLRSAAAYGGPREGAPLRGLLLDILA